jgi:uncharacterized protein VirK/YbjX
MLRSFFKRIGFQLKGIAQTYAPYWNMARRNRNWSLSYLVSHSLKLSNLLTSKSTRSQVFRMLALPKFADFTSEYPRVPFKYLDDSYLARGLTQSARAAALANHYEYLHATFSENFLRRILLDQVTLWDESVEACHYRIALGYTPPPFDAEGELSLFFQADDVVIYVLSFTVVPGWITGLQARHALLVSRVHGVRGSFEQIRQARKVLEEVNPPVALVAALQGIAEALRIQHISGICSTNQRCYSDANSIVFKAAYDDLWNSLGATKSASNFFQIPLPLQEKPLNLVKRNHRARKKSKRQLKRLIAEEVCTSIRCQSTLRHVE